MQNKNSHKKSETHRELCLDEFLEEDNGRFDEEDEDSVTDDTLEFLCLDDETIENYQHTRRQASRPGAKAPKGHDVVYEKDAYDEEDPYEDGRDEYASYDKEESYADDEREEDELYEGDEYGEEDEPYDDDEYGEEDELYDDDEYGEEDELYDDDEYGEEDELYDDDEYEEDDEEDEYDQYDDKREGVIVRFKEFLSDMTALDMIVAMLGIVVLAGVFVTGGLYINARSIEKQVQTFASVGKEIEGISVIGENGLLAVTESARIGGMIGLSQEPEDDMQSQESADGENEAVEVSLNITSIQSDMKIKFVNKATGKLIGSVPFEVEVAGSKKTFNLKDEDKDGMIYQTGIDAGSYQVTVKPFSGNEYSGYKLPTSASTINVTDQIAYKKVDVADEVKTEAEINAAAEDTAVQNVVESALTDTVEWVESTKTPVGEGAEVYEAVAKTDIPDPWTVSSAYVKLVEEGEEEEEIVVSLNSSSLDLEKGESASLKVSVTGTSYRYTVDWSSSDSAVASVSEGSVSAVGVGNATITARVAVGSMIQELTCSVTVSEVSASDNNNDNNQDNNQGNEKEEENDKSQDVVYTNITISGDGEVTVGKTVTLTAQTKPAGGNVAWSSNNESVAKVDSKGVVTGVAEGSAKITAKCSDAEDITAELTVTVKKANTESSVDGGAKLKDKDGNQMYYKNASGDYKEATYDDYKKYDVFYKKTVQATEYRYTGWQTIDGYVYFFDKNGNYVTGEQVIQGARYTFGSDGRLSSGSGTMGIDVSKWNGSIDWNAVKNSGVSYVIIRCGYRGSSTGVLVEDPKFKSNIKGAKAVGLKVGVYFFSQAVNEVEAVEEASMALNLVSGYGLNYPIFLDVEASGGRGDGISKEMRTAVCKAFCATVQNSGYTAGIYANKTWFSEKINTASLTGYKIWLAQYASAPTYTATRYDMWQYSSQGKVSGISGNVDMNISYLNY